MSEEKLSKDGKSGGIKTLIVMQETLGWSTATSYLIGTAAVSAYVKKKGHDIICLNLNHNKSLGNKSSMAMVYDFVKKHDPDIVAVGCLVTDWMKAKEICDAAKVAKPNVVVVIGGGFVTYSPEEAMRLIPVADFGIIGEGEVTLHELLVALEHRESAENIAGLIGRDSVGDVFVTQKREAIPDIDALPFLDYEGFGLFEEIRRTNSFAINTSRSCPFSCTYCTHSGGGRYRQQSLDRVFEEIDYVLGHVPQAKIVSIYDELFAAKQERFEQFIERIAPYNLDLHLPMRADSIKDPELFKKAYAAGCKEIQIGLESGCDAVLKSMRKGTSKAMLREFYKNVSESGVFFFSGMIFGDAAETMETVEESFAFAKELSELNPKIFTGVSGIRLYPGSPLYDNAKANKKISDTTAHILANIPYVNVSKMTDDEYNYLVKRIIPAMDVCHWVRHFTNLNKFSNSARRIGAESFEKSYTYLRIAEIDRNEKTYRLSYECPKCNTKFDTVAKELTYGIDFEDSSFCASCKSEKNRVYKAMLLDDKFFQIIKPVLKEFLEVGNVGIAGMGSFFARYRLEFKKLFDELEMSSRNSFLLSDGSPDIADKSVVGGRKIYHTENVLNKVKNIVVPNSFYSQIREVVNSKEPEINVYGLFELPFYESC